MVPDYAIGFVNLEGFDPAPSYVVPLAILSFSLGVGVFPLGAYCIWLKSPSETKLLYKSIYSILILYSFLLHALIHYTIPVFILPYRIAILLTGPAINLDISANFWLSLMITIVCPIFSANGALIYFRTDALLPPSHLLAKSYIRRSFYLTLSVHYIPVFFICYIGGNGDQEAAKKKAFESFGFVTEYLWDPHTVVYDTSPYSLSLQILCLYVGIFAGIPILLGIFMLIYAFFLVRQLHKTASRKTVKMHTVFLITLCAQAAVYSFLLFAPVFLFIFSVVIESRSQSFAFSLSAVFATSPAAGCFTMILVNKHYRNFIFPFLKGQKKSLYF